MIGKHTEGKIKPILARVGSKYMKNDTTGTGNSF